MAIRVRKLAKELKQSSGDVLGLLHHLGYPHYKTPDDMIPDPVIGKLRSAVKNGVRARPVAVDERPRPAAPTAPLPTSDLMSQLVPGVVRQGGGAPPRPPAERAVPPEASARRAIESLQEELDAARAEAAVARADLARLQAQHASTVAELRAATASARAEAPQEGVAVSTLLHERGLRGSDEAHRAWIELAKARRLDPLGEARLGVAEADRVRKALSELVLVGGARPEGLTGPVVVVAPDRADIPGADELRARAGRVSEQLLLHGIRRLRVVGLPPRWHGVLRDTFDRRVEVAFVASEAAAQEVEPDATWVVGGSGSTDADERRVFRTPSGLPEALDGVLAALRRA